jgi:hypothetical protein
MKIKKKRFVMKALNMEVGRRERDLYWIKCLTFECINLSFMINDCVSGWGHSVAGYDL